MCSRVNSCEKHYKSLRSFEFGQTCSTRADLAVFHAREVIPVLIRSRADLCSTTSRQNTAFHLCAENGREQCLAQLLSPANRDHGNAAEKIIAEKAIAQAVNQVNQYGQSPLHLAAWRGFPALCELLVTSQASLEATDGSGSTPIQLSVRKDHPKCVQRLLKLRSDPKAINGHGLGLLQQACVRCGPDRAAQGPG